MPTSSTVDFRSKKPALIYSAMAGFTILMLGAVTMLYVLPVEDTAGGLHDLIRPTALSDWWDWRLFEDHFIERLGVALLAAISATIAAYWRTLWLTPSQSPVKTYFETDPQLYRGNDVYNKLPQYFAQGAGAKARGGLWIAPHIQMPAAFETDNIFINGNHNAGKSTIFRALVEQKIASGAHVFMHCFKGELSSGFGPGDAVLIAPHVADTWAWDIANDVVNEEDARELARRIVPSSDNPFWSDSARAVFTALLVDLMEKRGRSWTWLDLGVAMCPDPETIKPILARQRINPAPLLMFDEGGQPTNTTHGVLATLITAVLATVKSLALAWEGTPAHRRFSVRKWLTDPDFPHKVVIFQSSARYDALAQLVGRGIIDRIRAFLADSSVPDSNERRIVLALDEMAQLGELDTFHRLIATGRSKGLMVIAATQSIAQMKELYRGRADVIRQLFRWQIVSTVPQGEPGETLASMLMSKRKVWWMEDNLERPTGKEPKKVRREEERYPFTPAEIERDLGVQVDAYGNRVVRALLCGAGDVYLLDYPNTTWFVRRKTFKPAEWTRPIGPSSAVRPAAGRP